MPLDIAGLTDIGRKRDHNEDALLLLPAHGLAVVCDGMGGHSSGEVASRIAVDTVRDFFALANQPESTWPFLPDRKLDAAKGWLQVAARWAHERIREAGEAGSGAHRGMGTTFVSVLVRDGRATFAWAGDSRGYLFQKGRLRQATSDHSLLNELLRSGRLSEEEAQTFQHRNVITRALGMAQDLEVDFAVHDVRLGDLCMLCSDGLSNFLDEARLAEVLAAATDLKQTCRHLIDEANARGGADNITVALVRA